MRDLLLIAEVGVNHDGDLRKAIAMTHRAAEAGFDAVKFQYWNIDELLAPTAPAAPYQGEGDQHALLADLRLDTAALATLEREAHGEGLRFIVTPDGERACRELLSLHLDALKIGSGDADNGLLLDRAVRSGLPIIASTGMMTEPELASLVNRLAPAREVTLLHCVSTYPTALAENGLNRMREIAELSGRPVGLSDHSIGIVAAAAAVGMGAVAVEKHVTWSMRARGPDHAMSLPLDEAAEWVRTLRELHLGLSAAGRSQGERDNRAVVRKGLYLQRAVAAGSEIAAADLVPLRPLLDGIPAGELGAVAGHAAVHSLKAGQLLRWSDLQG
ncbi:MAG TPA: N-acetylneuraminate synthase family protein [Candidatus Binatia bacterium]|nr:N-acetylneuraminate synthase family protein [Candidatus Binatia bacterium]